MGNVCAVGAGGLHVGGAQFQGHPAPAAPHGSAGFAGVPCGAGDGSQLPRSPSSGHGPWVGGGGGVGGPTRFLVLRESWCQEVNVPWAFLAHWHRHLAMLLLSLLPSDFGCNGAAGKGWSASRAAVAAGRRDAGVTGKRMGSRRGSGMGFGAGVGWHRSHLYQGKVCLLPPAEELAPGRYLPAPKHAAFQRMC